MGTFRKIVEKYHLKKIQVSRQWQNYKKEKHGATSTSSTTQTTILALAVPVLYNFCFIFYNFCTIFYNFCTTTISTISIRIPLWTHIGIGGASGID